MILFRRLNNAAPTLKPKTNNFSRLAKTPWDDLCQEKLLELTDHLRPHVDKAHMALSRARNLSSDPDSSFWTVGTAGAPLALLDSVTKQELNKEKINDGKNKNDESDKLALRRLQRMYCAAYRAWFACNYVLDRACHFPGEASKKSGPDESWLAAYKSCLLKTVAPCEDIEGVYDGFYRYAVWQLFPECCLDQKWFQCSVCDCLVQDRSHCDLESQRCQTPKCAGALHVFRLL